MTNPRVLHPQSAQADFVLFLPVVLTAGLSAASLHITSVKVQGVKSSVSSLQYLPSAANTAIRSAADAWFEDEDFWRECYPYLFSDERLMVAAEQMRQALALLGIERGSVLDLCCGPGQHAVALAHCGLTVTAVDRSAFLLGIARQKAAEAKVEIEFVPEDMRRFVRPQAFDGILNMYSSFGYFEEPNDDLTVLRNVYASLKPGGAFLLDTVNKAWLLNFVDPLRSVVEPDGTIFVQRYEMLDNGTRQSIEWNLTRDGRERIFKFYTRIYSGQELTDLMMRAGFASVELYGDLAGGKYGPMAQRLIVVGRKASG